MNPARRPPDLFSLPGLSRRLLARAALLALPLTAGALEKGDTFPELKVNGELLKNVKVVSLGPTSVTVICDRGVRNINPAFFGVKPGEIVATKKVPAFEYLFFGETKAQVEAKLFGKKTIKLNDYEFLLSLRYSGGEAVLSEVSLFGRSDWKANFHATEVKGQWDALVDYGNKRFGTPATAGGFLRTGDLQVGKVTYTHVWKLDGRTVRVGVGKKVKEVDGQGLEASFAYFNCKPAVAAAGAPAGKKKPAAASK